MATAERVQSTDSGKASKVYETGKDCEGCRMGAVVQGRGCDFKIIASEWKRRGLFSWLGGRGSFFPVFNHMHM